MNAQPGEAQGTAIRPPVLDAGSGRLNEALADYYAELEAGQEPDRQRLLGRYPDLADELTSFFTAKDSFEREAGPLHPGGGPAVALCPVAVSPLLRGLQVAGHELLEEIGRGGMGVVYKARQVHLGRVVALKMIRAGDLASAGDIQRFRAEAAVVASLDHPNIVPVYEVGEHEGQPCYSMKLVAGDNLAQRLRAGPLPPRQAAELLATVARAVHHAHQRGVLHRDLKPANILLDQAGTPHVTDFGLARRLVESSAAGPPLTASHAILGTASYMSPEQAGGQSRQLTTAADVHSLGAILHECLTGWPAFQGKSLLDTLRQVRDETPALPSALRSGIGRDLDTICRKCLEKDPQRRYESAAAFADDLERWLAGRPIEARPVGAAGRLWRWSRRQPVLAGLTAGLLALLVIAAVGATLAAVALNSLAEDRRQTAVAAGVAAEEAEKRRKEAEAERDATGKALNRAEGMRLTALSSAALKDDPAQALLLAIEGEQRAPGRMSHNALFNALNACREERTLPGDDSVILRTHFSADGRRVLGVTEAGTVLVWDATTGRKLIGRRGIWHHSMWQFQDACFSPDGRRYAVWYRSTTHADYVKVGPPHIRTSIYYTDRVVRIGDTTTGKFLTLLTGHEAQVSGATFSPDGRRLLTASEDGTARLWDADSGKLLQVFRSGRTALAGVLFSQNGKRILTWTSGRRRGTFQLPNNPYPADEKRNVIVDPREIEDPEDAAVQARFGKPTAYGGNTATSRGGGVDQDEQVYATAFDAESGRQLGKVCQSNLAQSYDIHRRPSCAVFNPDGSRFFLGQASFTWGAVHDTATGIRLLAVRDGEFRNAVRAAFSPDGRSLAVFITHPEDLRRCVLLVLDAETGQELSRIGDRDYPTALCFSPDGGHLAIASGKIARVWETRSYQETAICRGHTHEITSLAFSPDGRKLVTGSKDHTVRIWRVTSPGSHVLEVLQAHSREESDSDRIVSSVTFSPDGQLLATTGDESAVRLWDSRTGQPVSVLRGLAELPERSQIRERSLGRALSVQFSPEGRILVLTAALKTRIVRIPNEKPATVPYCPARLFDARGKELARFEADTYQVQTAVLSGDGKYLLTRETDSDTSHYMDFDLWGGGGIGSSSRSDRSHGLQVARLYEAASGKLLAVLREPEQRDPDTPKNSLPRTVQGIIVAAVFSPDGRYIATMGTPWASALPNRLHIWETSTGKIVRTIQSKQNDRARDIEWSPDGSRLLLHNSGRLIDAKTGELLATLSGASFFSHITAHGTPERTGVGSSFSPDGKRLAGVGANHALMILDATTGKTLAQGKGHSLPIRQIAFSRDGKRLVTASEDETARVWDTERGQELLTLNGHKGIVFDATFSPDGERVATACADGAFRIWRLDLLRAALASKPRELTAEERARFEIPSAK